MLLIFLTYFVCGEGCVCLCVVLHGSVYHIGYENTLQELVLSFSHESSGNGNQAISVGSSD